MTGRFGRRLVLGGVAAILGLCGGCISIPRIGQDTLGGESEKFSVTNWPETIFYVDGAGGGGPITDATPEIRRGLQAAGFVGDFRPFRWQSGLGALADQLMSGDSKRTHARRLAGEIRATLEMHPGGRVALIASSAGTAITVFALEELSDTERVESVVLMSSAMSADYDLSSALARVTGNVHVLTSDRDRLLTVVVPMVGCSDRAGDKAAGVAGFHLPAAATDATRAQYARVLHLPWRDEFRSHGHDGGHTDCKSPRFVQRVVAPLVAGSAHEPIVASAQRP